MPDHTLVTLDEYARMPDPGNKIDDLIDGVVVYRPLHSALHGIVAGNAGFTLSEYRSQVGGGSASMRCGLVIARNPDTVTGPDASFWRDRSGVRLDHGWPTVPPDAAFEVVDRDESYSAVMRRVMLLVGFGVRLLWLVDPVNETVTELRGGAVRLFDRAGELDGGDVLPGFACKVSDLFA